MWTLSGNYEYGCYTSTMESTASSLEEKVEKRSSTSHILKYEGIKGLK